MAYTNPSVSDFKAYFTRDFPYGIQTNTVLDSDISKALDEAGFNFNSGLVSNQTGYTMAYLYLTAHYLVMDLRASAQGIAGTFPWMSGSKSVGSVSESFQFPEALLKSPTLSHYAKTYYGAKYISLVYPRMMAPIFASFGGTQA